MGEAAPSVGVGMSFSEVIAKLDAGRPTPLYQQLQQAVREAIERRVLKAEFSKAPELAAS